MSQQVLITGATGYIGSVVAEKLLSSGYTVRGLVRSDVSARRAAKRGIIPAHGDVDDTAALEQAMYGVEAVIHTATYNGPMPGLSVEESAARAAATLRLLERSTAERGIRLISTSGTGVYGDTGTGAVDERTKVSSFGPFTEELTGAQADLEAAPHAHTVRAALVYGRAGSDPVLGSLAGVRQRGRAGYVRDERVITVVHVDDLADLYLLVLDHNQPPPLVIGAGETLLSEEVMAAAGLAAGVGDDLEQVTDEVAVASFAFLGYYLTMNMRVSGEVAREKLGWQPRRPSILEELRHGSYRHLYEKEEVSAANN